VQFDRRTGSFKPQIETTRTIAVTGEGVRFIWTIRALERAGFAVNADNDCMVTISDIGWKLQFQGHVSEFTTIESLIAHLRAV
jgi:hypothetical protein